MTEMVIEQETDKELKGEVTTYLDMANALQVTNDIEYLEADNLRKAGQDHKNKVKEKMGPIVSKAYEAHKAAKALENELIGPVDEARKVLGQKMVAYKTEVDRKKKEEEAKAAEQARIQQDAIHKAEENKRLEQSIRLASEGREDEAEALLSAPLPKVQSVAPVRPNGAPKTQTKFRSDWEIEISDPKKVPHEYTTIDLAKIKKVVRAMKGDIEIPGVVVTETKIPC